MTDKIARFFQKNYIEISDIMYITRRDRKSCLSLTNGRLAETYIPIKDLAEYLASEGFLCICKGIVVARSQIDHIENCTYFMKDGTTFQGRHRTAAAHRQLSKMLQSSSPAVSMSASDDGRICSRFSALDNMPVAYCIIELVLNKDGAGIDFIFRYCNKQMEVVEGKKISEMIDQSFYKVFPNADRKWLAAYTDVAVNGGIRYIQDYSPEIKKDLYVTCYQPMDGYCACLLIPMDDLLNSKPAIS